MVAHCFTMNDSGRCFGGVGLCHSCRIVGQQVWFVEQYIETLFIEDDFLIYWGGPKVMMRVDGLDINCVTRYVTCYWPRWLCCYVAPRLRVRYAACNIPRLYRRVLKFDDVIVTRLMCNFSLWESGTPMKCPLAWTIRPMIWETLPNPAIPRSSGSQVEYLDLRVFTSVSKSSWRMFNKLWDGRYALELTYSHKRVAGDSLGLTMII